MLHATLKTLSCLIITIIDFLNSINSLATWKLLPTTSWRTNASSYKLVHQFRSVDLDNLIYLVNSLLFSVLPPSLGCLEQAASSQFALCFIRGSQTGNISCAFSKQCASFHHVAWTITELARRNRKNCSIPWQKSDWRTTDKIDCTFALW